MIIFDLDGTLADCSHRRHFVDPELNDNYIPKACKINEWKYVHIETGKKFKKDWKAFYEACDQDKPIESTIEILRMFIFHKRPVEIWSGRCESVRTKTVDWLIEHVTWGNHIVIPPLRMRPIGNSTPDDLLKENWLNEHCSDLMNAILEARMPTNHNIEMVFDDRPRVLRMWERYGIWTFNCNQGKGEF